MFKKLFCGCTLFCIMAMLVIGCNKNETTSNKKENVFDIAEEQVVNVVKVNPEEEELPDEDHYVVACVETATKIANCETFEKQSINGVENTHFLMQEDGHGLAMFTASGGRDASGTNRDVLLRTTDYGETWEVNPKLFHYNRGANEMYAYENHVIMMGFCDKAGTGICYISKDYGATFTEYSINSLAINEEDEVSLEEIHGDVLNYNYENETILVGWYTNGCSYMEIGDKVKNISTKQQYFKIVEYDMDMIVQKVVYTEADNSSR